MQNNEWNIFENQILTEALIQLKDNSIVNTVPPPKDEWHSLVSHLNLVGYILLIILLCFAGTKSRCST
jgi:hypothetical protein